MNLLPAAIRPAANRGPTLHAAPNPFNPSTQIRYTTTAAGPVRLEVFDLAGRRIAVLMDGTIPAGVHDAVWNGEDRAGRVVAAGVYCARLTSATGVVTRRLVLVK